MRFTPLALIAAPIAALVVSASAHAAPLQGYKVTVGGRAHIEKRAAGTWLTFDLGPGSIAAVVPFGYKSTFPQFERLDGRLVEITGVVDGKTVITLTDPDQLKVVG